MVNINPQRTEELSVTCPALFLAAPASGQGKTTITSALARYFKNKGKRVRVFKTGPDYLDPQILQQASGQHVESLDMWMASEVWCRQKLFEAAQSSDLILIEGVMGIFDGEPSSADLAAKFGIPVTLVMDVKGMAQTAAAMVTGLANFRDDFTVNGLIANHCSTERHAQLIRDALPENTPLLSTFSRAENLALPERHLGLVQACEVQDELEVCFELGAQALIDGGLEKLSLDKWLRPVTFTAPTEDELSHYQIQPSLQGMIIGIAKDSAFSFIYQSNVDLLIKMGASIKFFSPLNDTTIPDVDGLWLPGGYPELHAKQLSENASMLNSIKSFFQNNKPILAECGGLLYCLESLSDLNNQNYQMLGLISGSGAMRGKRGCQGMQTACLPEGEIRGHAHHKSRSFNTPEPVAYARRQRHGAPGEEIYQVKKLTASYLHLFFPSNALAIAHLFNSDTYISNFEINKILKREASHVV